MFNYRKPNMFGMFANMFGAEQTKKTETNKHYII